MRVMDETQVTTRWAMRRSATIGTVVGIGAAGVLVLALTSGSPRDSGPKAPIATVIETSTTTAPVVETTTTVDVTATTVAPDVTATTTLTERVDGIDQRVTNLEQAPEPAAPTETTTVPTTAPPPPPDYSAPPCTTCAPQPTVTTTTEPL